MNLDTVITQLQTYATLFSGRVAGAAAYAKSVEDQVWLDFPAAYVIPLDDEATENQTMTGLIQTVTERIGVIVELDNTADRRGQAASDQFETARTSVFKAVLNWRPDWDPLNPTQNREPRGFSYGGGRLIDFDRARLFYQFEFLLDITISYEDGWQEPDEGTINEIDITVTTYPPTGEVVRLDPTLDLASPDNSGYVPTV